MYKYKAKEDQQAEKEGEERRNHQNIQNVCQPKGEKCSKSPRLR